MSGEADQKLLEKIENATVILIDIAGTSSSISFVKDTLFPFALKKAESFLNDKWEDETVKEIVKALQEADSEVAKEGEKDEIVKSLVAVLKKLTEKDSDVASFKKLQGLIYAEGYTGGDLKGHVYADVVSQLKLWANGKRVCVYSTGNVESQKLLFTHSVEGDLSAHITEYFDSSIGSKTNAESYTKIASKLVCKPEEVVFLTDSVEEAQAALEAKMYPVLVHREGNAEIPENSKKEFSVISSFTDLSSESSAKRKMEEPEQEAPPAKVAKTECEKSDAKKVTEAISNKVEEEKMEVDTEVPVETKEDKKLEEKQDDSKTTANNDETKKTETDAEKKEDTISETKEDKPNEPETEKKVPSKEETKSDDKLKTDAMETDSTEKTEEAGKQTEPKETEKTKDLTEKEQETIDKVDNSKETNTNGIDAKDKLEEKKETEQIATETTKGEKITSLEDEKTENKVEEKSGKSETEAIKTETESEVSKDAKIEEPMETKVEKSKEKATETELKTNDANETKTENDKSNDEVPTETKKEETADKEESNGKAEDTVADKTVELVEKSVKEAEEVNKNGNSSSEKDVEKSTEEKENHSDLANGAHENGDSKKVVEEETDIKVKKIEAESTETTETVSVEVTA